jgi:hypothetical protein
MGLRYSQLGEFDSAGPEPLRRAGERSRKYIVVRGLSLNAEARSSGDRAENPLRCCSA